MGQTKLTHRLESALDEIVAMFRNDDSTLYIAFEFLVSPGILSNLTMGSKFARALQEAETSVPKQGFNFWEPPQAMRQIVETVRAAVQRADGDSEAREIILSLLRDSEPQVIASVKVG